MGRGTSTGKGLRKCAFGTKVPDIGELPLGNSHCMTALLFPLFISISLSCPLCAAGDTSYSALWGGVLYHVCASGGVGRCLFYLVRATGPLSCCHVILVVPGPAIIGRGETHGGLLLFHQVACDCSFETILQSVSLGP